MTRYAFSALAGAFAGYMLLVVLANLEDFQFYTLRSAVTGRTAMSQIVEHPADRWIAPALFVVFLSAGAVAGVLAARWCRIVPKSPPA